MGDVDSAQLLEGARNLARNSGIRTDQRVLIHAERQTDPDLVMALWTALSEVSGDVSVITTDHWDHVRGDPPRTFRSALETVDVLVSTGHFLRSLEALYLKEAMYDRGTFYIHNEASSPAALASEYGRFPKELLSAIGMHVLNQIAGKDLDITTKAGTDLKISVRPETVGGYWYPYGYDGPGHKKGFPGGAFAFYPEGPVEGVLAVEGIPPEAKPPKLLLDEPLRLEFHDHRVVHMEGDCSDWLREWWDRDGDENSSWLGKCMWGIHPKAQSPDRRGASNPHILNFGMGNSMQYGGPAYSCTWVRGFIQHATVTANGETVIDVGRLTALEAPEVMATAERLGCDPSVLKQVDESLENSSDLFIPGVSV